jgi:hypothetical protein
MVSDYIRYTSDITSYVISKFRIITKFTILNTRDIRKVTSDELLAKLATRKMLFYTKITYILKLLLNVVTDEIEASVSGNTFLYACVRDVCRL